MALKLRLGGAWQDITGCKVFAGAAWRDIKAIKIYEGGAWRDAANFTTGGGTITLALSPTSINRTGHLSTITTTTVTATPTGGTAPYTYAWVKLSGDDIAAVSASSASTQFRATGMGIGDTRVATFRCTATDNLNSTDSEDISVTINCTESGAENPNL